MDKKTWKKIENVLAVLLCVSVLSVCVYQLRYGIDVQDTSSYLTKFRYFFEKGVGGNALYYLLGEFLGSIVFHIFPTLYAMNVTGLIVWSLTGILLYRILRPYLSTLPLVCAVLGGLGFGASWVRCVNWNAWSVLFLTFGILCMMNGFDTGKKRWFAAAGFVLGINAFVRMPNIVFLALVAVVVFYEISDKKQMLQHCLAMTAGGALAGIFGIVFSIVFLGFDKFKADLFWMMNSGGDTQSKHNFFAMFANLYAGGMDGIRQWIKYGLVLAALVAVCVLIRKKWKKDLTLPAVLLSAVLAAVIGFTREVAYSSCPTLLSVQNFLAFGGIGFGIFGAFYFYKKEKRFAAICLTEALTVLLLTIGTDTGSIFFRVYMTLPAAVIAAVLWKLPLKELRIAAVFAVVLTFATGFHCNLDYTYHDGEHGEAMTAQIDAPVFEGMKTTPSRAEYVTRLMELLAPYEDRELLTIGAFNVGCNVTDMKPFFDSAWADLDYLSMEEFHSVLEEKISQGNVPVIVIATEKINGAYWVPEKIEDLKELVATDLYQTLYSDEWYSVYVPSPN